jgi:predicted alpha/beta-hydrolase family hydrolase
VASSARVGWDGITTPMTANVKPKRRADQIAIARHPPNAMGMVASCFCPEHGNLGWIAAGIRIFCGSSLVGARVAVVVDADAVIACLPISTSQNFG